MPMKICCFVVVLCISSVVIDGRHLHQSPAKDSAEALSLLPDDIKRVTAETPLESEVAAPALEFGLSVKAQDGMFPDILLSLEVWIPGANIDMECAPYNVSETNAAGYDYTWNADSAHGTDYLFITTNSSQYSNAIAEDGEVADFYCRLQRQNGISSQFFLEMDVSYTKRKLIKKERDAMESIYNKCCKNSGSCQGWKENWHSVHLEHTEAIREVTNFDFCHMTSSICDESGHLLKLSMENFGLECAFPTEEISELSRLEKLILSKNELSGNIFIVADTLRRLKHLNEIILASNRLVGHLSREFEEEATNPFCTLARRSLLHLHLEKNGITGPIPECVLKEGSRLHDLILDNNPIAGTIPDVIPTESPLQVIRLSSANLTGKFPRTLSHVKNLVLLDLSENQLEGIVPADFGGSKTLQHIHLSNNRFTGKIPLGIAASVSLETADLSHNSFDSLPSQWLKEGPKTPLVNLDISHNQIKEDFPNVIALFPRLSTFYLNNNKFQGPLPEIDLLFPNAWVIDLSNNSFDGRIPNQWTAVGLLKGTAEEIRYQSPLLDLSNNQFTGALPGFFHEVENFPRSLQKIQAVDVHGNEISCPREGATSHIVGLESCRDVNEGPIVGPTSFDISNFTESGVGNITNEGVPGQQVALAADSESDDGHGAPVLIIVLCTFGGIVLLIAILTIAMRYRSRQMEKKVLATPRRSSGEIEASVKSQYDTPEEIENSRLRIGKKSSDHEVL